MIMNRTWWLLAGWPLRSWEAAARVRRSHSASVGITTAADRLGLKVRPYQGTGVGQIPFAVTEKCVVKLRWSFWSVTRVVGESGVIEWPSHVTQAIEDRFGERGFDGFVPWGLVSDKIIELDASNQTLRVLKKVPNEAAGWTKLALRKDWGILALETENPDGESPREGLKP